MKIVLFGATGYIGNEILNYALSSPSITSIIVVSRRALPTTPSDPKCKVLLVENFSSYPPNILSEFEDADACIWSIGTKPTGSLEQTRHVDVECTLATAKVFADLRVKNSGGSGKGGDKFRFVYVSGLLVVRDQKAGVWFLEKFRKLRGEVEEQLSVLGNERRDVLETYITRPAFVINRNIFSIFWSLLPNIKVDELAAATIDLASKGTQDQTVENAALVKRGAEVLKQKA